MADPQRYPVRVEVPVRFRDLDVFGHVNNAVYLTYCEIGRVEYARRVVDPAAGGAPGDLFPFVVAEASCRFLAPLVLGQTVVVQVRAPRVGSRSFDLEYRLSDLATGRPVATARTVQVGYDHGVRASAEVPAGYRERIEALEAEVRR